MITETVIIVLGILAALFSVLYYRAVLDTRKEGREHQLTLLKVQDEIDGKIHARYLEAEKQAQRALDGVRELSENEVRIRLAEARTEEAKSLAEKAANDRVARQRKPGSY